MELAFAVFKVLFFVFLFVTFRVTRRIFQPRGGMLRRFQAVAAGLTAQHGGTLYRTGSRRLLYVVDQEREIELDCFHRPRLTIRIRQSFPFSASLQRAPRLLYAFLESFIPPDTRIQGQPYFLSGDVETLRSRAGFLPSFEQLSAAGFSVRIMPDMLILTRRLNRPLLQERILMDWLEKAMQFARVCNTEPIVIPMQAVASDQCCAYCKGSISEQAIVVRCSSCNTAHHQDCFQLNGKCSVFGCVSNAATPQPELLMQQ